MNLIHYTESVIYKAWSNSIRTDYVKLTVLNLTFMMD
jgi:hypothetical protein